MTTLWIGPVSYDAEARAYLDASDHYLGNSPPGALFAVGVRCSGLSLIEGCDVRAAEVARARGLSRLIAYHDRTRHTGCIYRKAGFRKDGRTAPKRDGATGWGSRSGRNESAVAASFTPKRRWSLDLSEAA